MNYLSLDVGTTCCKCQLFSENGEILEYLSREYDFKEMDGAFYVDVEAVWQNVKDMVSQIAKKHEIHSLAVSSLGEAFVLLDKEDEILFYPMLYTDPRGEKEAEEIKKKIGEERAFQITGVLPHSMYSLSKLLWIRKNYPEIFEKADKVLLVCDYIGYMLTGERVIDYALASRTGAFDVEKLCFSTEILEAFSISNHLFSTPRRAGQIVAPIKAELIAELGVKGNPVLVLGSHDQVCSALGAGALQSGDAVDGMGTVECITVLFDKKSDNFMMGQQGYPCVPYAVDGLYCTYILNYSCGSTVNWLRKGVFHGYKGEEKDFFAYIEKEMKDEPSGILTLPYFGGCATPYQDLDIKGAMLGLTTQTADWQLYRSVMEGTAMEMRLNADIVQEYGIDLKGIVATGGGANSEKWLQIKADIQNLAIKTLRSSEGGLCGCALLQAVAMSSAKSLEEAKEIFVQYGKEFYPRTEKQSAYEKQYTKYKKIYKRIKEFY